MISSMLSCHVDPGLKSKIQKGEFVELEKLLPKNKRLSNDNRMELVFRGGRSYFTPAPPENRISDIRRWEQAFRVYAAIYSEANPSRAVEIWQYVYVINLAASTFVWENVANYDYTFRHLMAVNPGRSWSKIYNQMWNLSMKETLTKNNFFNFPSMKKDSEPSGNPKRPRKPKYCWPFYRGNCKHGIKCKFVHRCSYCDASDHALPGCNKKGGN